MMNFLKFNWIFNFKRYGSKVVVVVGLVYGYIILKLIVGSIIFSVIDIIIDIW